jgi:hypothetical protein
VTAPLFNEVTPFAKTDKLCQLHDILAMLFGRIFSLYPRCCHTYNRLKQGVAGRGGTAGAHLIPVSPYNYKQSVCQHSIGG